jgi:hypothetical protein
MVRSVRCAILARLLLISHNIIRKVEVVHCDNGHFLEKEVEQENHVQGEESSKGRLSPSEKKFSLLNFPVPGQNL